MNASPVDVVDREEIYQAGAEGAVARSDGTEVTIRRRAVSCSAYESSARAAAK